jgi:hypothetical protein
MRSLFRFGRQPSLRGAVTLAMAIWVATCGRLGATTVVPPEFGAAVNGSDFIVRAVVKSVKSEKRDRGAGAKIYTRVELDIVEVVAGRPPPKPIVLELLGGRVGDETLTVGGMPIFRIGDEDILFVRGNGRSICPLYGMMYGRYPVVRTADGRPAVLRSDGTALRRGAEMATPLAEASATAAADGGLATGPMTPEEFIREIRAAVRPDARLRREN